MCHPDRSDRARTPDAEHSRREALARYIERPYAWLLTLREVAAQSAATEQRGGKFAPATSAITRSAPRVNEQDA